MKKKLIRFALVLGLIGTVAAYPSLSFAASTFKVEAWGGGGGGGGANGFTPSSGGGGGGAYSVLNAVTATVQSYTVTVGGAGNQGDFTGNGFDGGDSSFVNSSTLLAKGGKGGQWRSGSPASGGGAGGAAASGVGDTKYSGGAGANGSAGNSAGGGGGGAGSTGAGGNASGATAGSGTTVGGGNGGTGGDAGVSPTNGSIYGGGGGGASGWGSFKGGFGGTGAVIITYPTGSLTATGGTITTNGGNTIHTFTSSGTFEVTAIGGTQTATNMMMCSYF